MLENQLVFDESFLVNIFGFWNLQFHWGAGFALCCRQRRKSWEEEKQNGKHRESKEKQSKKRNRISKHLRQNVGRGRDAGNAGQFRGLR